MAYEVKKLKGMLKILQVLCNGYDPDQPRDDKGRWTSAYSTMVKENNRVIVDGPKDLIGKDLYSVRSTDVQKGNVAPGKSVDYEELPPAEFNIAPTLAQAISDAGLNDAFELTMVSNVPRPDGGVYDSDLTIRFRKGGIAMIVEVNGSQYHNPDDVRSSPPKPQRWIDQQFTPGGIGYSKHRNEQLGVSGDPPMRNGRRVNWDDFADKVGLNYQDYLVKLQEYTKHGYPYAELNIPSGYMSDAYMKSWIEFNIIGRLKGIKDMHQDTVAEDWMENPQYKNYVKSARIMLNGFDPNQPRDDKGRWTSGTDYSKMSYEELDKAQHDAIAYLNEHPSDPEAIQKFSQTMADIQVARDNLDKNNPQEAARRDDEEYRQRADRQQEAQEDLTKSDEPKTVSRERGYESINWVRSDAREVDPYLEIPQDTRSTIISVAACLGGNVSVEVNTQDGYKQFVLNSDRGTIDFSVGNDFVAVDLVFMYKQAQGQNRGTDAMGAIMKLAADRNLPVEFLAYRDVDSDMYNGYYTWAKMGFDGLAQLNALHATSGMSTVDLQDAMKDIGALSGSGRYAKVSKIIEALGEDWWKENGCSFDVSVPGPQANRIVDQYKASKEG